MNHPGLVHLSHLTEHASSSCLESFPASFVEPHAYWSPLEKTAFFNSLERHSRWKPDLIAEEIGGNKTAADVCLYIALLEQGSARALRKRSKRDAYPIAHELSKEWIAVENAAADELCGKEAEWQGALLKHERAQELKEVKNSFRRGLETARGGDGGGNDLTMSKITKRKHDELNQDNLAWEERFQVRKRELSDLWKQEDMLSSLDERYLKTMDKMIRTLEITDASNATEGGSRQEHENFGADTRAQLKVFLSATPPRTSPSPATKIPEIPPDLSPASRRRLRNRLWTRRKRALESGLPVSELPMDTGRLKRGRKPSKVSSHPPTSADRLNPGVRGDEAGDEDEDEAIDRSESAYVRKPYGWSKLMARQVSGSSLGADGMDLFHLEKFVHVMSLLGRVHALSNEANSIEEFEESSEEPSNLSYPFLRLLRACVIRFVTSLVAYTVLHKDVETRQKRRIREISQTGRADEIRAENIREALLHMDKDMNTKQFFTRLRRTVKEAAAAQAPSGKETGSETDDSDKTGTSDDEPSTREAEDDVSQSVWCKRVFDKVFSPRYNGTQSASPLFWNPSGLAAFGGTDNSVLPDELDEVGLLEELRAEQKVEDADREADHIYEHGLWTEIGVPRVKQPEPVTKVAIEQKITFSQEPRGTQASRHLNAEAGPSHSLRFRPPGGPVKSRVYIDSDEDA